MPTSLFMFSHTVVALRLEQARLHIIFISHQSLKHSVMDSDSSSLSLILTKFVVFHEIKVQLGSTVCSLIYFTAESLHMFRASQHPSSGVLRTVTTASGTGHNIGTAASLRGPDRDLTTEGSSCTDIMTCTGGCG